MCGLKNPLYACLSLLPQPPDEFLPCRGGSEGLGGSGVSGDPGGFGSWVQGLRFGVSYLRSGVHLDFSGEKVFPV